MIAHSDPLFETDYYKLLREVYNTVEE
jgi:hypothetical protein